jgi:hypothetical protein
MPITRKIDDIPLGQHYSANFFAACVNGNVEMVNGLLLLGAKLHVDSEQINSKNSEDANNADSRRHAIGRGLWDCTLRR